MFGILTIVVAGGSSYCASAFANPPTDMGWGNAPLDYLGGIGFNDNPDDGFLLIYAGALIGGGGTISGTAVAAKGWKVGDLSDTWVAYIWGDVTSAGALQTAYGDSAEASLTITPDTSAGVWASCLTYGTTLAYESSSFASSGGSLLRLMDATSDGVLSLGIDFAGGGTPTAVSSTTISAPLAESAPWAAVGLALS